MLIDGVGENDIVAADLLYTGETQVYSEIISKDS